MPDENTAPTPSDRADDSTRAEAATTDGGGTATAQAETAETGGAGSVQTGAGSRLGALLSGVRFGKFVSVGIVGAVFDTAVFLSLTQLGVVPELATLVGIETAILVMFAVNERWTFADEGEGDGRSLLGRLGRSHGVRAVGSTTQFLVFVAIFRGVPTTVLFAGVNLWLLVAKGGGIAVGMLVNYVFESLFTWQVHRD
jgi:putative flippase GtrA